MTQLSFPARPAVYLAGPDVFLPEAAARGEALKRLCAAHGLDGIFPLDALPGEPPEWACLPPAQAIARRNEAHIRRSRAVIANLTPFRGPSADVGTVYEVGFARALGLPVFGWSTDPRDYLARCGASQQDGVWRDGEGLQVECFGLAENLMIACGVAELVRSAEGGRWTELGGFEACVAGVARVLEG